MVIVIISKGIENNPMAVNIMPTAIEGIKITTAATYIDLNNISNIRNIAIKTKDSVLI